MDVEHQSILRFRAGLLAGNLLLAVLASACVDDAHEAAAGSSDAPDPPGARRARLEELLRDREAQRRRERANRSAPYETVEKDW